METAESNPNPNPNNGNPSDGAGTMRPRDQQDREIADGISGVRQILASLEDDTELRQILLPRGYDDDEVSKGEVLQVAARTTFLDRQRAMGDEEAAADDLAVLLRTARHDYADFRRTARIKCKGQADRTKLGLVGPVPRNLQRFITLATTSYTEAGQQPYLAVLTKKGYPAAKLTALLAQLEGIDQAVKEHKKAGATAQKATKLRDTAWGLLKGWLNELRETGKVAFRHAPEQTRKLDF